ncbi:hypothetical protein L596_027196 [Steinernema carpocapsae]|uniref:Uncharacterized protein n=1 Tax=Steinernema carpocapsae TaxID=34508 RepID=A0A4U5M3L8_STECR|nr:hypothetical protein L596_027196 [Steinernema carpocapsae]
MRSIFLALFVLAVLVFLQTSAQIFLREERRVAPAPEEDIFAQVQKLSRGARLRRDWSDPMAQYTGNSFWTSP